VGEADGKRETARSCAAWIDVENAIARIGLGLVGVPADHDLNTSCPRTEIEVLEIVKHVDIGSCQFNGDVFRKGLAPGLGIYVAAHGVDRSDVL